MPLHLLNFANEQAAISDQVVSQFYMPPDLPPEDPDYLPGTWQGGNIMPNESVWLDAVSQSGWWMIIDSDAEGLADHLSCRLSWDNANAVILGGTFTGNEIAILAASPTPAGSYNPWPNSPPE